MLGNALPSVLMADDDEDDCLLASSAFQEAGMAAKLCLVADGKELMDYLNRNGTFCDPAQSPRPNLILLDLNMPRKDGREALVEIKSDPRLNTIPIVILTTSRQERDIVLCKKAGAVDFVTKPASFEGWVQIVKSLAAYLPRGESGTPA
jgi:CheY-like chemotaxis protein